MKNITSPLKVFWVIIISVLVAETFLMFILQFADMDMMTSTTHKYLVLLDGVLLCLILTPLLLKFVYWPMRDNVKVLDKSRQELNKTVDELTIALTEVKQLRGIIPICASCKKIRDDGGLWQQVEAYIEEHSDADFSHSMCPDCTKSFYEELEKYDKVDKK